MAERDIFVHLKYNINRNEFVEINTNTRDSSEIVSEFLRATQLGAGSDNQRAAVRPTYYISIFLNLTNDSFKYQHDCGNEALMSDILLEFLNQKANQP
jgi:hypothetical protein